MPNLTVDEENEAFAARLKALLAAAGHPRHGAGAYLARRYNVSTVTANDWLNGTHKPTTRLAKRIAVDHGSTFDALYFGPQPKLNPISVRTHPADVTHVTSRAQSERVGEAASSGEATEILVWEHEGELPPGDYVLVPQLSLHLSAGNGRAAVEIDRELPQAFRADWIRAKRLKAKYLTCMTAAGDSMAPWITDGDSLVIDTGDTDVRDGEPYALRYGNELRVKRLYRRFDGVLVLRSDNLDKTKYPDEIVTATDLEHVEVIGRVVWRGG